MICDSWLVAKRMRYMQSMREVRAGIGKSANKNLQQANNNTTYGWSKTGVDVVLLIGIWQHVLTGGATKPQLTPPKLASARMLRKQELQI